MYFFLFKPYSNFCFNPVPTSASNLVTNSASVGVTIFNSIQIYLFYIVSFLNVFGYQLSYKKPTSGTLGIGEQLTDKGLFNYVVWRRLNIERY